MANSEANPQHPEAPPELPITFDNPETWEDEDEQSGGVEAQPDPAGPSPDDLQQEIDRLKAENEQTNKRLADNKAHHDRLFQENRVATQMLAELYGQQDGSRKAAEIKLEAPEAPTQEQIIQDPSLAIKYAQQHGERVADYTRRRVLAEIKPFLGATAQSAPLVQQLVNLQRTQAVLTAKSAIDPGEHQHFDEMVPRIADMMAKNANGPALSIDPNSWLTTYRALGGQAKPVKAKSPTPMSARPSRRTSGESASPTSSPPSWASALARRAGVDPNEYWRRHNERLGRNA